MPRLFNDGERVHLAVIKVDDDVMIIDFVPNHHRDYENEVVKRLALANHLIEVEIVEWDDCDNSYRVKLLDPRLHSTHGLMWASPQYIRRMSHGSGMTCHECKNGYPYAEPNYEMDKLICWSCCDSNGWKYEKKNGVVTLRK